MINEFEESSICVGFVSGSFDLLHAGHVLFLEDALIQCDRLIVALRCDENCIESVSARWFRLHGCVFVDQIIPYETDEELETLINVLNPDVRILGSEYKNIDFVGQDLPGHYDKCYFHENRNAFSTKKLGKKMAKRELQKHMELKDEKNTESI